MSGNSQSQETGFVSVPSGLTLPYQLIGPELEKVTQLLAERLRNAHPFIDEIVRYSFRLGGKRLRPMLVLLAGKACGAITPEHIAAGAALELVHTGTLVHDDILDGATFRRHLETIHLKWDPHAAVLVGDLLLTQAMDLMTQCDNMEAWRLMCQACQKTCQGELLQNADQGHFEMTRDEYISIIGGKTAALLQCACHLGALFAGASPELTAKFSQFGFNLGMAFQIVDDILDLVGEEKNMGKTLGTDILNGKPTLPLILWLSQARQDEREEMIAFLCDENIATNQRIARVKNVLITSNMVDAAWNEARNLVHNAMNELKAESAPRQSDPESLTALKAFDDLASFVVDRNR
ncbi:MAG: polyprenyl synthetase family protein [Thermoguttaceae bacterium]|nr:polyprenyl synthetase family protein [Thermoguttaceae bacterium]